MLARYGTERKTEADGRPVPNPLRSNVPDASQPSGVVQEETASETIVRLEAANAEPRAQRGQARPGSRWDPSADGQACLAGGDDPVEPGPWFVENHQDAYKVKRLRVGRDRGARPTCAWRRASRPARQQRAAADAVPTKRMRVAVQGRPGHGLTQDRSPSSTRPPRRTAGE